MARHAIDEGHGRLAGPRLPAHLLTRGEADFCVWRTALELSADVDQVRRWVIAASEMGSWRCQAPASRPGASVATNAGGDAGGTPAG